MEFLDLETTISGKITERAYGRTGLQIHALWALKSLLLSSLLWSVHVIKTIGEPEGNIAIKAVGRRGEGSFGRLWKGIV